MSSIEANIPRLSLQDRERIRLLIYNQPDVMLDIFESLTRKLIAVGVFEPRDIEGIFIEGLRSYSGAKPESAEDDSNG